MKYELMNTARSLVDDGGGRIEIAAPAETDYFRDTDGSYTASSAPFYHTLAGEDFIYRCRVRPDFRETYDAGGILACGSDERWVKCAFERTDLGYSSVVAVVTDGFSDDSNGEMIGDDAVWLQLVRQGDRWCFHYSRDGRTWKMVRYFRLVLPQGVPVGIFAQSPAGGGCTVGFTDVALLGQTYRNIRKAE